MPSQPALVVFDLSGTTVEDRGQVPEAFSAAFQRARLSVSPDELRAVRGATKRQAILSLMPAGPDRAARADQVYESFREELKARYSGGNVQPVAGAAETFAWLRDRQIQFALTTGFDRDITCLLLGALGWTGIADAVVCGDDVAHGRPAPDLILSAMALTGIREVRLVAAVGDTSLDLRAGRNAGVGWNVGVLSGAHDRETLQAEPHTHILTSVASLPALWSSNLV